MLYRYAYIVYEYMLSHNKTIIYEVSVLPVRRQGLTVMGKYAPSIVPDHPQCGSNIMHRTTEQTVGCCIISSRIYGTLRIQKKKLWKFRNLRCISVVVTFLSQTLKVP